MVKKKKKPDLASIKAEKDVVKAAKKICLDEETNLYDYATAAIRAMNTRKLRFKLAANGD